MTLKTNLIAGYAGQLYVALIGILLLPLFLTLLGRESYGLIGLFSSLQTVFLLLDLGLSQTISRETSRFCSGALVAKVYLQRYRAVLLAFLLIALVGGSSLYLSAGWLAHSWLHTEQMAASEAQSVLEVIAIVVALRWFSGIFRGVISGAERLVWLNVFNSLVATLRFVLVFLVFECFGYTVLVFFWYQLVLSILELLTLYLMANTLLPSGIQAAGWSIRPLQAIGRFALGVAGTSVIWVVVTQLDKLLISGLVSLADFGVFNLAVTVASGLLVVTGPVGAALMPRLTHLYAEQHMTTFVLTYRKAAQLVAVVAGSVCFSVMAVAEPLLTSWTGDPNVAAESSGVLRWYILGNFFLSLNVFPYYLQYAYGITRYHAYGHLLLLLVLVPAMFGAVRVAGIDGAAWCWALVHALYFVGWVSYSHHKLLPGLHRQWLIADLLPILLPAIVVSAVCFFWFDVQSGRWLNLVLCAAVGGSVFLAAAAGCTWMREIMFNYTQSLWRR